MKFAGVVLGLGVLVSSSNAIAQNTNASIAFGNRHAVALLTNGDVLTWGENVYCQLGRASRGNAGRTPAIVMRNATAIAAAGDHTLVLTEDGKVYGWGMNPEGALGTGNTNDQCEGPALVESLARHTVTHIATGNGFSVATTADGDLYCSGDNSVGQCPVGRSGPRGSLHQGADHRSLPATSREVRAGAFHTLILSKDKKLYALGRGRDGQLGDGKAVNGFAPRRDLTDVVSFAAGTWHSVAARADGSVWTWGNDAKSQLCDGGTTNRATPARIALPAGARVAQVAAGGHSTLMRTADGRGHRMRRQPVRAARNRAADRAAPTPISVPAVKSQVLAIGGANGAVSADGCSVSLVGSNDHGIVSTADTPAARTFSVRANLSLCGVRGCRSAADRGESRAARRRVELLDHARAGGCSRRARDSPDCDRRCSQPRICSRRTPRSWPRRSRCDSAPRFRRDRRMMAARACTSRRCRSARPTARGCGRPAAK